MNDFNRRKYRMNEFLVFIRDIFIQNPTLSFDTNGSVNAIYRFLNRWGVPAQEQSVDLSNLGVFASWISRYRNVPNINTFVSDNWKYFCQFKNRENEIYSNSDDAIKMYIPLDSAHIEKGANMIFDYLAKNNIPHLSKIGKNIRFDDIVVRLSDYKDAVNLFNFVQQQPYLKEGLIEANPFAFSIGNIAFASDKKLSYNYTIAQLINTYISTRIKEGLVNDVNIEDFKYFCKDYYQERFINNEKIDETLNDFRDGKNRNEEMTFVNLKEVIGLFIASNDPNFTFNDYLKHYNRVSDRDNFNLEVEKVKAKRQKDNGLTSSNNDWHVDNRYSSDQIGGLDNLLLNMIDTVSKQYHKDYAYLVLNEFMKNGDKKYLTRENNVRMSFVENDVFGKMNEVLRREKITINEYCDNLIEKRKQKALEEAVVTNYVKYQKEYEKGNTEMSGVDVAHNGLLLLVNKGIYSGFTRSNYARRNLMNFVTPNDALNIMQNSLSATDRYEIMNSPNSTERLIEHYTQEVLSKKNVVRYNSK